TYDQGFGRTYINGTEVHTFDMTTISGYPNGNLGAGTQDLRIGGRPLFVQYFDGLIDEVGIYDSVLTAADVLALYSAAPPLGSVTLYLNENSFLNASGATAQVVFPAASQEGTLSTVCNQNPAPDYVENNFTLRHACGFGYLTGEFTANLDGGEFIVDGAEQVDISMPMGFRSFGIRIEDGFSGAGGAGCPAHDSSFTFAFKDGNTLVGQILIDPPTNQGSFMGVTSTVPFNNVEIREVGAPLDSFTGAFCEDDFFGTIFAAP
ncbi:MAG: LamG-like jellyroll fold domain-containing protein, partial [Woeseia sp.]